MKVSVIVSFYKDLDALDLVVKALAAQQQSNMEIIVSENGNHIETVRHIEKFRKQYLFKIIHIFQTKDEETKKEGVLNKAIKSSTGDLLIFMNADCVPHSKFIKAYLKNAKNNILCLGKKVMLDFETTQTLYRHKNLNILSFLNLSKTRSTKLKYAIYAPFLKEFNRKINFNTSFGILKKHLYEINGFDEDFAASGAGKLLDLAWRLKAVGVKFKSISFEAIQYQLFQKTIQNLMPSAKELELLEQKQKNKLHYCTNGLMQA
jgi:cellulose synthase/poly-beta-1,6-N-acetylglucosamine synthase-like glycosyltransferase